ncbi:hypothetical protein H920_14645 [Fukomys damarensis]|uniref:Uncharacterized protein n=1 Tax=Fukomys damarensis TaxID=885580 RepID=A0A091D0D3_FUKDA|nr:hypothetical protein H920_14645 [Fukomys damarensis]
MKMVYEKQPPLSSTAPHFAATELPGQTASQPSHSGEGCPGGQAGNGDRLRPHSQRASASMSSPNCLLSKLPAAYMPSTSFLALLAAASSLIDSASRCKCLPEMSCPCEKGQCVHTHVKPVTGKCVIGNGAKWTGAGSMDRLGRDGMPRLPGYDAICVHPKGKGLLEGIASVPASKMLPISCLEALGIWQVSATVVIIKTVVVVSAILYCFALVHAAGQLWLLLVLDASHLLCYQIQKYQLGMLH